MQSLVVLNGHPDPRPERFCAALAAAYAGGGTAGGWRTITLAVGELPLSSLQQQANDEAPVVVPDAAAGAMLSAIEDADRLAIIYPLWFDKPPAPLTALFAHVAPRKAHIVVTMDMPAFAYRSILRGPERLPLLAVPGIVAEQPVLIGCVSSIGLEQRRGWLRTLRDLGERTALGAVVAPSRLQALALSFDRTMAELFV